MNELELLNYIRNPLSEEQMDIMYKAHGVVYERCRLYVDFIVSVVDLVHTTYLGDDYTDYREQINHFKWCWKKTIKNFGKEKIYFREDSELFVYLFDFVLHCYYKVEEKKDLPNQIAQFWSFTFSLNEIKTQAELDTMLETYKLFEKTVKNGKK